MVSRIAKQKEDFNPPGASLKKQAKASLDQKFDAAKHAVQTEHDQEEVKTAEPIHESKFDSIPINCLD